MFRILICSACILTLFFTLNSVFAREIHVAKTGNNLHSGSIRSPLLTISHAAHIAMPGDTIIVHEGTYREWVKPTRGGTDEYNRIVYKAADGENVFVKGSERITNWIKEEGKVWRVEIPNFFFGDYNPYELTVKEEYMTYGMWHHRGDVYLNGKGFFEKQTLEEVELWKNRWYCEVDDSITTIWANFENKNPNEELAEINVRESIFMPEIACLQFITVSGFNFSHAASHWASPILEYQSGAVGTRLGKNWIIENCKISDIRNVGIILGLAPGVDYENIELFGDHIVRNNIIRRCGQAAIAGNNGATRCLIEGNLIEEINYRKEFGGHETAALKFHNSVDLVISNNLIRNVYRQEDQAAFGMWIDWANQGTRITRNIIYNTETATIFLEMNHGPILIDNNILIGKAGISSNSEALVFAHNLFVDCSFSYNFHPDRQSPYREPHTTKTIERKTVVLQDDKWFNNIFIGKGHNNVNEAPGYQSNYNLFLKGAKKSTFEDVGSIESTFNPMFQMEENENGVEILFNMNESPFQMKNRRINSDLIGTFTTTQVQLEDRFGNPIAVDSDFNNNEYKKYLPGILSNLVKGQNKINWTDRAK